MAHRENIEIKTKFESIDECMENCRDIKRTWVVPLPGFRKIYGVVNGDGSFKLSSQRKNSAIFEFVGSIKTRNSDVYMAGEIRPKTRYKYSIYILNVILSVIGACMIFTINPVLIVIGTIYIGIG